MRAPTIVYMHSGLGNQLFQLAAARQLALHRNSQTEVVGGEHTIDLLERTLGQGLIRATRKLDVRIPAVVQPSTVGLYVNRVARRSFRSYSNILFQSPRLQGDAPTDQYERLKTSRRPVLIQGYFQHPAYAPEASAKLAHELADRLPARLERPNVLGIHVRRGDYLRLGWQLAAQFYLDAAARLDPERRQAVLVASDDILAAEALAGRLTQLGWTATQSQPARHPFDDLFVLAGCQNMVMSNSTYSWWAARVGDEYWATDERKVACPDPWLPTAAQPAAPPNRLAVPAMLESELSA